MDSILHDLRYAFRTLLRSAGSTTVIVLTLALAMGTGAVIFTVIDTVLQIVPARDRGRTVYLAATDPQHGRRRTYASAPDYADWKAQSTSFEAVGALAFGTFNLSEVDTPVRLSAIRASTELLDVLGVNPEIGRSFRADEDRPGANRVVLLSHRFWRRQFGANTSAVGAVLRLDGERYAILGVLPASLDAGLFRRVDVWVPLALDPGRAARDQRTLGVFARLKRGVTPSQGSAEIAAIAQNLQQQYPATNTGIGAVADPLVEAMGGGGVRFVLGMLIVMAALLLAVACANVANVTLARTASRRRELAVRAAIGASRTRIVRQLMIEDLVLSLVGGTVGLLLCSWEVDAVKALAGSDMTILSDLSVDWRVLLFALSVSLVAPLVFGLLPAIRSSILEVRDSLKETSLSVAGGPRGRRLRSMLVGSQVALVLTLLIQVGVLARSTFALSRQPMGFDPNGLLTLRIDLPPIRYSDSGRIHGFFDALIPRLEGLPGVESAAAIDRLPIAAREVPARFSIEGRVSGVPTDQPWAAVASVTSGYRRTMRIPLLSGRDLAPHAPDAAPPVLISRLAAQRDWPLGDAIGNRLRLESGPLRDRWIEIAGIVGDVRSSDADAKPVPQMYLLHADLPQRAMAIMVRSDGDPGLIAGAIRAQVAQLDTDQPIYAVASMRQVLFDDLASTYILVGMVVALALIALGLAAVGIYGMISYAVTQRTHEIGVRMALGAEPGAVQWLLVRQGLTPVVLGTPLGLAAGFASVRLTASALNEVNARDPATYAGVLLVLAVVALLATYVPARRATAVDPVSALRAE